MYFGSDITSVCEMTRIRWIRKRNYIYLKCNWIYNTKYKGEQHKPTDIKGILVYVNLLPTTTLMLFGYNVFNMILAWQSEMPQVEEVKWIH